MSKRTQRTSQTRGTTSVYRLRGLIGYKHIRSAVPGAPVTAYRSSEFRGAAQGGNWDTASPLPRTDRQLSGGDGRSVLLDARHRLICVAITLALLTTNVNGDDRQFERK